MVSGDELDVTKQSDVKGVADAVMTSATESPGTSALTKLIFFGVIVGVVLTFLRTRRASVSEKSLA